MSNNCQMSHHKNLSHTRAKLTHIHISLSVTLVYGLSVYYVITYIMFMIEILKCKYLQDWFSVIILYILEFSMHY